MLNEKVIFLSELGIALAEIMFLLEISNKIR